MDVAGETREGLSRIESFPFSLPEQNDARAVRIGDDKIGETVPVDVSQGTIAAAVGILPSKAGLYEAARRLGVVLGGKLELQNPQSSGLSVDRQDLSGGALCQLGVGDGTGPINLKLQLGAEAAGTVLETGAERAILTLSRHIAEVFSSIAVEIDNLRQRKLFGRVHQDCRRREPAFGLLQEDIRLLPAQDDQVVLAIPVQVTGRHDPLSRGDVGNTDHRVIVPLAGGGLKIDHQPVGNAEAGDVGASVAIEIADGHRGQLLVERDRFMIKPRVSLHVVDAGKPRLDGRFFWPAPLQQQIDSRVAVVE